MLERATLRLFQGGLVYPLGLGPHCRAPILWLASFFGTIWNFPRRRIQSQRCEGGLPPLTVGWGVNWAVRSGSLTALGTPFTEARHFPKQIAAPGPAWEGASPRRS